MRRSGTEPVRKRERYHHGDLKAELIEAAKQLIARNGVDGFKVSDACRLAGVSTAAPYRHFADRDALLAAVSRDGFTRLADSTAAAGARHPVGSVEAIIAIGQTYVSFVTRSPELFQLMWGGVRQDYHYPDAHAEGRRCFAVLLQAVAALLGPDRSSQAELLAIAMPMWSLVHGTASLILGGRIGAVAPQLDVNDHIDRATRAMLIGLTADPTRRPTPEPTSDTSQAPERQS